VQSLLMEIDIVSIEFVENTKAKCPNAGASIPLRP